MKQKSNRQLMNQQNKLFEYFANTMTDKEVKWLNKLLELERELTLREGQ